MVRQRCRHAGQGPWRARVIVCEIDPVRAVEALMGRLPGNGQRGGRLCGDIFITVTGCRDALDRRHFTRMKDGVILANAGHFDVENNKAHLESVAERRRRSALTLNSLTCREGIKFTCLLKAVWLTWRPGTATRRKLWICHSLSRRSQPGY
jgi:S-adenosylhomocysteine hydrolase